MKGCVSINKYNTSTEDFKRYLQDYANMTLTPAKNPPFYICPLCGSGGHGNWNSDGAFSVKGDYWTCFSCGEHGDIYDLVGKIEGIEDFKAQKDRIFELFSSSGTVINKNIVPQKQRPKTLEKPIIKADYRRYISQCMNNANKTNYLTERGFTAETIKRCKLGYDSKKRGVVIPYNRECSYYVIRRVDTEGGKSKYWKLPTEEAGTEPLYNEFALYQNSPCFITEGTLDAISILQTADFIVSAIALGGVGYGKLLATLEKRKPLFPLILAFDKDERGRETTEKLSHELDNLNIPYIIAKWTVEGKDPNDMMCNDTDQFAEDIAQNVLAATEKQENPESMEQHEGQPLQGTETHTEEASLEESEIPPEEVETEETFNGIWTAEKLYNDFFDKLNEGFTCISTGFPKFDRLLEGGLYEGLYILGADSSLGKTTFFLQLASQISAGGYPVLFYSLEMSRYELFAKGISRNTYDITLKAGISDRAAQRTRFLMKAETWNKDDKQRHDVLTAATEQYLKESENLYICEGNNGTNLDTVRGIMTKIKSQTEKSPVLIVDYFQILLMTVNEGTDKQRADRAVTELKRISRDFDVPVIAISSLNREGYEGTVRKASFKESGGIEYSADVLMGLQPQGIEDIDKKEQKAYYDKCVAERVRTLEIKILKQRNGTIGGEDVFYFTPAFNHFRESEVFSDVAEGDPTDPFKNIAQMVI